MRECKIGSLSEWRIHGGLNSFALTKQEVQEIAMRIEVFSIMRPKNDKVDLFQFSRDWILMLNWELRGNPERLHVAIISVDYKARLRKWCEYDASDAFSLQFVDSWNICHALHMSVTFQKGWEDKYGCDITSTRYCRMKMLALLEPHLGEV